MKLTLILLSLFILESSWAFWPLVEREGESTLRTASQLEKISKKWDQTSVLSTLEERGILDSLTKGEKTARDLLVDLLKLPESKCSDHCEGYLKDMIYYLRAKDQIDDTAGLILLAYAKKNTKQLSWLKKKNLDLPSYVLTLKGVERSRGFLNAPMETSILTKRTERVNLKPWGKVSPRQELFLRYNIFEIKALANILVKTQKRLLAQRISIVVDYEGDEEDDEIIDVGPAEKYRFAHKMLTLEIAQETMSQGMLAGSAPTGPHLIMATSELGHVEEDVLAELMNMPELKAKKNNKTKLYLNALWSIGKTGLMAIPGGVYFILPIVIIESYAQGKKLKEAKNAPTLF